MSKAPKQRKVQLHYQPYQQAGNSSNIAVSSNTSDVGNGSSSAIDYALSEMPLHMDPVLAGFSSNLSRNLWDDWNENDPNMVKFDMFSSDETSSANETVSTASLASSHGFLASLAHAHDSSAVSNLHYQLQQQLDHSSSAVQGSEGHLEAMDVDSTRTQRNGFHALPSPSRLNVKRSLSEDIVNMLDDDDMFRGSHAAAKQQNVHNHQAFGFSNHLSAATGAASPSTPNPTQQQQQQSFHQQFQQQQQQQHYQQQQQQQQSTAQPQQLLVQHATNWLTGFPAANLQPQSPAQPPPLSPTSAARIEAHNNRPDPTPMERAAAAISSTMVAVPNPCKESAPPATPTTATPTSTATAVAPSPFSAYSFMSAAMETSSKSAGEGTSEGDSKNAANPFAMQGGVSNGGMMMHPGFMMYSMPMMGNYAAAAAAMGMVPMGAMQMGPMGMPMGAMPMGAMQMGPMGMGPMGAMPMGMPMMQMPMGMPLGGALGGALPVDSDASKAPKTLQPKGLAPSGAGAGANNASFVSIARKPEEPEVSSILKTLMEEEAKKKEKKLERNRDSARESRKKQQTYVETLENGIKRLQINRDLVVAYRWGVTGGPAPSAKDRLDWAERVGVVTGASESFSTIQNPTNFKNLMKINRQRRALSLARHDKERAVAKCFVCVGRQLAELRTKILELQVLRNLSNPAHHAAQELATILRLSPAQRVELERHSRSVFGDQVLHMVKLFKVFFALREQAERLQLMSPALELYVREVCGLDQLHRLLQWTEVHRATIEGPLSTDFTL